MKRVAQTAQYEEKVKKSKFIGYCYPVDSKDKAEQLITQKENEHHKATHVCRAYRLVTKNEVYSYNTDDGEPAQSSGPPIESALEGRGLVNSLCIVVRYFGGTELGIGGLIRAYGGVAGKTLDRAGAVEIVRKKKIKVKAPHESYPDLLKIVQKREIDFQQEYDQEGGIIIASIPEEKVDDFLRDIELIQGSEILKQ